MLFLGNVGVNVGFWGALPAGILMTFFVAGTGGLSRYRSAVRFTGLDQLDRAISDSMW